MLIGFLNKKETLDINVHSTYFVINNFHLGIILSLYFGLIVLGYYTTALLSIPTIRWMTVVHVLLTIFGTISIYMLVKVQLHIESKTGVVEFFVKHLKTIRRVNLTLFSVFILVLLSQLVFLINFALSIFKRLV